jgi:DNA mismatch repair protein MutS
MADKSKETPLMKQYNQIKSKYPDALLLFRVGDFYETFGEDAIKAAKILGIVLTARNNGGSKIELAGFPHHSLESYLPKLVRAGYRVAVCDQLEDPKMTKTIVKRGVTEIVTPGVAYNDQVLNSKSNNFLAALYFGKNHYGLALLDVSTGEFLVAEGKEDYINKLIQSFNPSEVLYPKHHTTQFKEIFGNNLHGFKLEDWVFSMDYAKDILNRHFSTQSLKGFGIDNMTDGVIAAGAALHYLSETQNDRIGHVNKIQRIETDNHVWLDRFTIRNLELVHSPHENGVTLTDVIDHTQTAMGGRLLKRWVLLPLLEKSKIDARLETVEHLYKSKELLEKIRFHLSQLCDLERVIAKAAVARINPKEIITLKNTLLQNIEIKKTLDNSDSKKLQSVGSQIIELNDLIYLLNTQLLEDPAISIAKGSVMNHGIHAELDELRGLSKSGKQYLEDLQDREAERTGISSLKIAFNNVFGYYIEVRNTHKDKVPEDWIRKQTLVNAERYITEELKEYETKILGAEGRIAVIETELFNALVMQLQAYVEKIQKNAVILAQLDCLACFAHVSHENNYHKPVIFEDKKLHIMAGRHPVIEKQLSYEETYIPNDVELTPDEQQIIMITGPNMSGKSALLRQTALIVIMAQIGCFVPADAAHIGIVDKIFTRVGASDNMSAGESTFMVEMNETSSILNNVTERSLVILDEIGRGTSTYDGISIAWAIAEYLHQHPQARCKTLFATHYHELNEMTNQFPRIKNYNVAVKEISNKIIFMRKLVPGGSEHSFGIHVAKMAGMPKEVLQRATSLLKELEKSHKPREQEKIKESIQSPGMQLSIFQLDDPTLQQIKDELIKLDINSLTPVEALMKLNEIKRMVGG